MKKTIEKIEIDIHTHAHISKIYILRRRKMSGKYFWLFNIDKVLLIYETAPIRFQGLYNMKNTGDNTENLKNILNIIEIYMTK